MNAMTRRKLEMAARVRDFVRSHPSEGASYAVALANFEALLRRAEEHIAQQYAGLIEASGATARRVELRQLLHTQLLRHLAGVGLVATKGRPELVNTFKLPEGNSPTQAFLSAAKGKLHKAETERELLVSKGMSETLLDDLAKAVSEFEATNEQSRASRRDHVGAWADLAAVTVEIQEQVRLLDGLVRYRFGKDPEVMAVWESSRNVAGPFRAKASTPLAEEVEEEKGPDRGEIAPAA